MKRRDVLSTTAVLVSAGCLGGSDNDGGGGSETEITSEPPATGTDTVTGGTAEPTTDTGTETATVETVRPTTETTSTATETAAEGTQNTPLPIPDAPTDSRKDTPLTGEARVTFADSDSRVVVTGTIVAKNGCQAAVLDSVEETNTGLTVTIATERDAPTDAACSMALVEIEYRFVVPIENPPESVTVVHRGAGGKRTITTAKRG